MSTSAAHYNSHLLGISSAITTYNYASEISNTLTLDRVADSSLQQVNNKTTKIKSITSSRSGALYYAVPYGDQKAFYDPSQKYQQTQITPYEARSSWLLPVLKSAFEFKELTENWDSYGSPKITEDAFQSLLNVLFQVQNEILPSPFICPVPGGGLQLEWEIGEYELELEFLPDGSIEFLTVDKSANHLEDGMMEGKLERTNGIARIHELLAWLLSK
ncbi:hypothetical protein VB780_09460 [Leptolyngbya sp. CCNP1308]|uniref:hypothetical protein n=1 Tax=Leptolyngbya sp. CCNP1308 TaxID=3110255 RepID=UPI002B21CD1E|nr:hypothetical protein [Leptolyngbya sp. CCNP1308]MEA5448793.1 hypothetical protein [Leptolyngbya sp. CCNP1308]